MGTQAVEVQGLFSDRPHTLLEQEARRVTQARVSELQTVVARGLTQASLLPWFAPSPSWPFLSTL